MEMIIEYEIESGLYDDKIKGNCAWCNAKISKSRSHYMNHGNMCAPCASRVNLVMNKKITQEEADQMLKERIYEESR